MSRCLLLLVLLSLAPGCTWSTAEVPVSRRVWLRDCCAAPDVVGAALCPLETTSADVPGWASGRVVAQTVESVLIKMLKSLFELKSLA